MKRLFTFLLVFFIWLQFISPGVQAAEKLTGYLFWGEGCPHCAKEKEFLAEIKPKYPSFTLKSYEIYHSKENTGILEEVAGTLNVQVQGVPFFLIGDQHFTGYAEGVTSEEIEDRIKYCVEHSCPDSVAPIVSKLNTGTAGPAGAGPAPQQKNVKGTSLAIPFFGTLNTASVSLPVLAVIMGILDGFNPCAMWVLFFLISMLFDMKNRRRMWTLGSVFIAASAAVYFVFMSAWLNLIIFLGFIVWIRIVIGLVAIISGWYHLKEGLSKEDPACKVSHTGYRKNIFEKIKNTVHQRSYLLALFGIIALAFMVNLVELLCSAGLPAVFTQVLTLNNLPMWQYYSYILIYIFFFMLDDLIVFIVSMITLRATGITNKYSKVSRLIGGALLLIIGLLLIFKPEVLLFG